MRKEQAIFGEGVEIDLNNNRKNRKSSIQIIIFAVNLLDFALYSVALHRKTSFYKTADYFFICIFRCGSGIYFQNV